MAHCEHCFLPAENPTSIDYAKKLVEDLQAQGHETLVLVPDTFGAEGLWLESGLLFKNRLYGHDTVKHTGIAWTSGRPLLAGQSQHLLELAVRNRLEIVSITAPVPEGFRGMAHESEVREAISLVHRFNRTTKLTAHLKICVIFTITRDRIELDATKEMIAFAKSVSADMVRFTRFIDLSEHHRMLHKVLPQERNTRFYENLLSTVKADGFDLPIMISSDFGTSGSEALCQGSRFGSCSGGRRYFSIVNDRVYPCVELLRPPIGKVASVASKTGENVYTVEFDPVRLRQLNELVTCPEYDGCIGYSICARQMRGLSSPLL